MASSDSSIDVPLQNLNYGRRDGQAQQALGCPVSSHKRAPLIQRSAIMPAFRISSPPNEVLTDQSLNRLALVLSEVESRLLIIAIKIASSFPDIWIEGDNQTLESRQNFDNGLRYARDTLQSIRDGQSAFSDAYLKGSGLHIYWDRVALKYPEILNTRQQERPLLNDIRHEVETMANYARRIPGILYLLATRDKLHFEIRNNFFRIWEILDKIVEAHFQHGFSLPRP